MSSSFHTYMETPYEETNLMFASQVWWEAVPLRSKVIGYEVFYSMTAVEDLGQWQRKTVGLTTSIDLVNLERHAQVMCQWQNTAMNFLFPFTYVDLNTIKF